MQWFRGGLVFKAHGLCVSLNSTLESDEEKEEERPTAPAFGVRRGLYMYV